MPIKDQKNLVRRPPVVVVMGHIDHGKSTLLDYIRKSNVVAKEAGGITQHVGAYQAEYKSADGKNHIFTFLDTPGHEAFCSIRERGAQAADIAVLVVSAEDGVKPQTLEALREIKAAKIPYVVAINKIDKPNADIDKTKSSLGENEIYVEGWGGDIPVVAISALTGQGIPELLDMLNLVAEIQELNSELDKPAEGVVIESEVDARKGISATLLIKNGSLKTGVYVVADETYAPVRYIENFKGAKIAEGTPSMPVVISGWNAIPSCGALFRTIVSKKEAEGLAAVQKLENSKMKAVENKPAPKKDGKIAKEDEPKIEVLPLIIKADVIGSLEGVKFELGKIKHDRVKLKIVADGIGDINENDVKMASSDPNIILLGFNVGTDKKAQAIIERSPFPLKVKLYKIIYELTEFVKNTLLEKVPKEYIDELIGRAKIAVVFSKQKDKQIVGGKVQEGMLETGSQVRIMRRDVEIGKGLLRELQQQKKRVSEIREGYEFGSMIESKTEIAEGDKIEAVKTIEKK